MEKERCGDKEDLSLLLLHKKGLLIQILLCLPTVSLLRCKSVCKSWRDLIQTSLFIDLHTTNTFFNSSSSKFGSFILHVCFGIERAILMLSSQSDSESEDESVSISGGSNDDQEGEEPVVVVDNLGFNMCSKEKIVGSCNGLVCLHEGYKKISLWNPATEKYRLLPESITIDRALCNLIAFGFDVKTKEYKVVQFTGLKPRSNNEPGFYSCQIQVYSLNTDSWRLLQGITCLPGYPFGYTDSSALYLNGTCFFLAHFFYSRRYPCIPQNDRFIISFDFTKEIITPIQLPEHDRNQELCLCSLDDKIALFTSPKVSYYDDELNRAYDICEDFNIWVLNYEHGSSTSLNKDSWTKLYSFQIQLKGIEDWYIPTGISNDGMFALLASKFGKNMCLYNLVTNEVKCDFLSRTNVRSKAHAYKTSLVSVIGGNGAGSSSSSSSP